MSHAIHQVSRLCNSLIHLSKGKVKYQGKELSIGIEQFFNKFSAEAFHIIGKTDVIEIDNICLNGEKNVFKREVKVREFEKVNLSFSFKSAISNEQYGVFISIYDRELKGVAFLATEFSKTDFTCLRMVLGM